MRSLRPLLAAVLVLILPGCGMNQPDEKDQSVGPGPGPARTTYATISDGLGGTIKVAQKVAYAPQRVTDEPRLPAGAFFDNSRDDRATLRDAVIAPRSTRSAAAAPAVARFTAPARRETLETRVVPAPVGADLNLRQAGPARDTATGSTVVAALEKFERTAYDKASEIFSRVAWGATASRPAQAMPHPSRVTVHHTDGNRPESLNGAIVEMRGIQAFHKSKWADIGYHFVIDGSGRVFEGRNAEVLGAHVGAANWNNIGIALMGNYDKQDINDEQKSALKKLVAFVAVRYNGDTTHRDFIQGHNHYNNTDCPGKNIERYLPQLRGEVDAEVKAIRGNNGEVRTAFAPKLAVSQS